MDIVFKNKEQLKELKKEVIRGRPIAIKAIKEYDKVFSLFAQATIQTWHCLKMVEVHVERELEKGAVTIEKDFFRKPFDYERSKRAKENLQGERYVEGLYHVVKYSAFFEGRSFIDEMCTNFGAVDAAMDILESIAYEHPETAESE